MPFHECPYSSNGPGGESVIFVTLTYIGTERYEVARPAPGGYPEDMPAYVEGVSRRGAPAPPGGVGIVR